MYKKKKGKKHCGFLHSAWGVGEKTPQTDFGGTQKFKLFFWIFFFQKKTLLNFLRGEILLPFFPFPPLFPFRFCSVFVLEGRDFFRIIKSFLIFPQSWFFFFYPVFFFGLCFLGTLKTPHLFLKRKFLGNGGGGKKRGGGGRAFLRGGGGFLKWFFN